MQFPKITFSMDRVAESKERKKNLYLNGKADRTPISFIPAGFVSTSEHKDEVGNFITKLEHPEYVIEDVILGANYNLSAFPDSDWIPMFGTYHFGEGIVPSMFGAEQLPNDQNPPYQKGRIMKSIEDVEWLEKEFDPERGYGKLYKDFVMMCIEATDGKIPVEIHDHQSPYGVATKLLKNEDLMQ